MPAFFGVATDGVDGEFVHCQSKVDQEANGGCIASNPPSLLEAPPSPPAPTVPPPPPINPRDQTCGQGGTFIHYGVTYSSGIGQWKPVFRQTAPVGNRTKADWMSTNTLYPDNPNYSILSQVGNYRMKDGSIHFKLKYPRLPGKDTNTWNQRNNPVTALSANEGPGVVIPGELAFTGDAFNGLEKNFVNGAQSLLEGSNGKWGYAIGAVTAVGDGFPGPNEQVATQVELYVCDLNAVTTAAPRLAAITPKPTELQYTDNAADFTCEFDYSENATPVFSSILPKSASGATTLTITGANMGIVEPTVHVGQSVCTVIAFTQLASNVQQIKCTAPAMTAGWYHVRIHVPARGFAAHPDADNAIHSFESVLDISRVEPLEGSWSGGMTVTVHGAGFSNRQRNNTVVVVVGKETKLAHVLSATHEQLVVVMPSFETEGTDGKFTTDATNPGTKTPTAGLDAKAHIIVATKTDLQQLPVFGQTNPVAHRYARENIDPAAFVAEQMRGEFNKPSSMFVDDGRAPLWLERRTHYAGTSDCVDASVCEFFYKDSVTPTITAISPRSAVRGDTLTLTGTRLTVGSGIDYDVSIGDQICTVDVNTITAVQATCTLGATPAGEHRVFFTNHKTGTGRISSNLTLTSQLQVSSVSHTTGSHGGGHLITIQGSGFGGGTATGGRIRRDGAWGGWEIFEYTRQEKATENLGAKVKMCNQDCTVIQSDYGSIQCYTPAVQTIESVKLLVTAETSLLAPKGKIISSMAKMSVEGVSVGTAAFDRVFDLAFEHDTNDCFTGIDFGKGNAAAVEKVRWFPVHQRRHRVVGGVFEGSNDNKAWDVMHTITSSTEAWNFAKLKSFLKVQYRFVRYRGPAGSKCIMAELEFVGVVVSATHSCDIFIGTQASLSHPSLGPSTTNFEVVSEFNTGSTYVILKS